MYLLYYSRCGISVSILGTDLLKRRVYKEGGIISQVLFSMKEVQQVLKKSKKKTNIKNTTLN